MRKKKTKPRGLNMFCSVLATGILCAAAPQVDLREQLIRERIEIAHTELVLGYAVPEVYTPEPVPVPAEKPRYPQEAYDTPDKPVKAAKKPEPVLEKVEIATGGLLGRLFGIRPANAGLPTVTGVDLKKPGYAAVYAAAKRHGVDPNLALRIAKQESRGNCKARSSANARGVMQVIPSTARPHGVSASELYNCKKGAEAGVKELKTLLADTNGDLRKTLVGYNCGRGCWKRKRLPRETTQYIQIVGGGKI
jgi:hypothetical protein